MNGVEETKGMILQDFNRRIIHLEDCAIQKTAELAISTGQHDKAIEKLTTLYEKGVFFVIVLAFLSGANTVINTIELVKGFIVK